MIFTRLRPFTFLFFLMFALMVVPFVSEAQQAGIVRGVIMERGTTTRLGDAEVVNKRTGASVQSNSFGFFQIGGLVTDTLMIFRIEYATTEAAVTSTKDMVIYLNRGTNLKEVKITAGQNRKEEFKEIKQDYRDKGTFYEGKPPLLSYIFSPLTAVYELFGKTPKNARRFGKYATTELQQSEIDGLFNEFMVKKHTPLKGGKELDYFMINYRPEYSKARKWAEYDAIKYIRDAYTKYTEDLKANPNLTNPNLDSLKREILKADSLKRIK
ncbi:hypothetical protein LPB86_03035 [Pedobacter sp. MC2016-14]|uniref:hypothetical protein n=1 Tax=Pedobacter sp. MC2016-14 TaxID=2897327 RepID=UPI001E43D84D|nr:hypothetical protein [Pedobacter sp. MC2016-14]MCD0487185.1 hypothetical protein [Pedobacter sp. MC2016-14]